VSFRPKDNYDNSFRVDTRVLAAFNQADEDRRILAKLVERFRDYPETDDEIEAAMEIVNRLKGG
jgi:hypothetical protein